MDRKFTCLHMYVLAYHCQYVNIIDCLLITAITCPNLNAPINGQIYVTGIIPGSRAEYQCNNNYILEGVTSRQCQTNGQWTNQIPECLRKHYLYKIETDHLEYQLHILYYKYIYITGQNWRFCDHIYFCFKLDYCSCSHKLIRQIIL